MLAIGASLSCYLPLTIKAALVAITAINLWYTLRNDNKKPLTRLVYQQEKGWQLLENGNSRGFRLLRTSIVTHSAIILDLEFLEKGTALSLLSKKAGFNHYKQVLIPADALSPEHYRRLLVTIQTT